MGLKITKESVIRGVVVGLFTMGGIMLKEAITNNDDAPSWMKAVVDNVGKSVSPSIGMPSGNGPMDWNTRYDRDRQREFELTKMRAQHEHEERMAKIKATAVTVEPITEGEKASAESNS